MATPVWQRMKYLSDLPKDRYRSAARQQAYSYNVVPTPTTRSSGKSTEAGALNEKQDGRGPSPGPATPTNQLQQKKQQNGRNGVSGRGQSPTFGGARNNGSGLEAANANDAADAISPVTSASAAPPHMSEDARTGDSSVEPAVGSSSFGKPSIVTRMSAGSKRFVIHLKDAVFSGWANVLLVFVPIGIAVNAAGLNAGIVFAMNAVAIVPLAGLLSHATESVAVRLGDTLGALLNVSFGNAVELIIFIIALVKKEIAIVQASLLGSILANLLLILGMAFLFGGLRYREQVYNSTVTQMSACLLSLSVTSLLLPTAFHASFNSASAAKATNQVLKVSRGTSVVLLVVYVLYLLFQLKSHAYMYESTPQEIIDEESFPGVLADIMNSSSSDETSSSSSSDSDASASTNITNAHKRFKRVFKRARGKSSASISSATGSGTKSALSSPSITDGQGSFMEMHSQQPSRRQSTYAAAFNETGVDADHEDNVTGGPRIRDFVTENTRSAEGSRSPERRRRSTKHRSRHHRKPKEASKRDVGEVNVVSADDEKAHAAIEEEPKTTGFGDGVQVIGSEELSNTQTRTAFNMRLASTIPRPALPKMFSNNVFMTPAPTTPSHMRAPAPSQPPGSPRGLRRTSSLPDRLNEHAASMPTRPIITRTDPLPPYQHQRQHRTIQFPDVQTEQAVEDDEDEKPPMSRTSALVLLLATTALVAVCAEAMVDAIPAMVSDSAVSQTFIGLIVLPIVGNAAEHVTAVTVATRNKMDLAIGVAVGSSIQIALFVTPVVVLLGWIINVDMTLYFNLFETISLFVTAFVVNFLVLDGRSNYLEGSLLIAAYVIIALGAFFYPQTSDQSAVGSVGADARIG